MSIGIIRCQGAEYAPVFFNEIAMKSESEMQLRISSNAAEKLDFVTCFTFHLLWLCPGFDWTTVFDIIEQNNRLCIIETRIYTYSV